MPLLTLFSDPLFLLILLLYSLGPLRIVEDELVHADSHHPEPARKAPVDEANNLVNVDGLIQIFELVKVHVLIVNWLVAVHVVDS